MSSVAPYSLGTCLTSLHLQKRNHSSASSSVQQQPPLLVQKENQLKRREAISLSFSFGLLHSFLQPIIPLTAIAAEAVPCELTVAPSGLSFCDKVVGTGSQAVKGQLIKVTIFFCLVSSLITLSYV
jgi:peptidylprolyl isomerase